jgi:nucleoid-associated protein YgaU
MKTCRILYIIVLLVLQISHSIGQEDSIDDADLQTLLGDEKNPSKEIKEVKETSSEVSSETVDLSALESPASSPEKKPSESVAAEAENSDGEESAPKAEESLEALPKDDSQQTTVDSSTGSGDDLESIKWDLGLEDGSQTEATPETAKSPIKATPVPSFTKSQEKEPEVFDVGREERELLSLAQNIQGQITDNEWSEVATAAKAETYTVVKDDWLFKISKKLFGSGFYYPKIWSLNTFITNPHFIEPGMLLSFTTGSGSQAPELKLGTFSDDELSATPGSLGNSNPADLNNFGEDTVPVWINEKTDLEKQGVYFQYASEETMDDLKEVGEQALNKEYENYEPPKSEFEVVVPNNYDKSGFDKNSRIIYSVKEGYYLSTFVSTNIVQDFGKLTNGPNENIYFTIGDRAYVEFDTTLNVLPGDKFSIYSAGGRVSHENSDREGYKFTVLAQIKVIKKIRNKWEVEIIDVSGVPQRGDRVTAYTPKIERITRTFNSRLIEAAILASYLPSQIILAYGDVVYLDRGRADGVEMGNVFEVYGFKDRGLQKNITDQPTYKIGELTVITLTDNFATALVTLSHRDFYAGDIAMTKTKDAHLREMNARNARQNSAQETLGGKALEELDVELNMENLNDDLLKQADKIQLTEDELAELERQEREKSVIKDSEKDLKALERLESEIEQAEKILNDAKLDEDKLLDQQNLNEIEKKTQNGDDESLDEIEDNLGKRYVDEDLNAKDNPFGLSEFDVEEVDELLNVEKKEKEK